MSELFARDIMNRKVVTISKNATVGDLARLLIKNKVSGVPVVNENSNIIGMVTEADIILKESTLPLPLSFSTAFMNKYETFTKDNKEYLNTKIEDVMTRKVKTVREDTKRTKVVNIMINNNINRIPVVDENDKLVGIITRANIIESIIGEK